MRLFWLPVVFHALAFAEETSTGHLVAADIHDRPNISRLPKCSGLVAVGILINTSTALHGEAPPQLQAKLIQVKKIWSEAPHNAFTDLIRWHDRWYCGFREGESHAGNRGHLRIITSDDGEDWESAATLEDPVYDLRDANLSVTPTGQLMAVGGAQLADADGRKTGTFASYTDDGTQWTTPALILPLGRWMWGVTWHDQTAWGVSYGTPERRGVNSLLKSDDGHKFTVCVDDFFSAKEYPTEARIRFGDDGTAYCLQRCDGSPNLAYLGTAQTPYLHWKWDSLGRYIGGPNLLQLPSGHWIAAGRLLDGKKMRTALMSLDVKQATVTPILGLPSGGDCSYPGLVWHDGQLWMSYYSSHEGRTSIYLARIQVASRARQD